MFNKKEKELVKTINNVLLKKKELSAYYKNKLMKLSKEISKKNLKEASNKLVKKNNKQKGGNNFKKNDIVIYTKSPKSDKRYVIKEVIQNIFGFFPKYKIISIENYKLDIHTNNNIIEVDEKFIEKVKYKKNQLVLFKGIKYKILKDYENYKLDIDTNIELIELKKNNENNSTKNTNINDKSVEVKQIQFELLSDDIMMHSSMFVDKAFTANMVEDDNEIDSNMINSMNTTLSDYSFRLSSGKSGALVYLLGKYEYNSVEKKSKFKPYFVLKYSNDAKKKVTSNGKTNKKPINQKKNKYNSGLKYIRAIREIYLAKKFAESYEKNITNEINKRSISSNSTNSSSIKMSEEIKKKIHEIELTPEVINIGFFRDHEIIEDFLLLDKEGPIKRIVTTNENPNTKTVSNSEGCFYKKTRVGVKQNNIKVKNGKLINNKSNKKKELIYENCHYKNSYYYISDKDIEIKYGIKRNNNGQPISSNNQPLSFKIKNCDIADQSEIKIEDIRKVLRLVPIKGYELDLEEENCLINYDIIQDVIKEIGNNTIKKQMGTLNEEQLNQVISNLKKKYNILNIKHEVLLKQDINKYLMINHIKELNKNDKKKYLNKNELSKDVKNYFKKGSKESKFYDLNKEHVYIPFIMQGLVEGKPLFNYISKEDSEHKKKQFKSEKNKVEISIKVDKDFKILTNSQRLKILSQLALTLYKFKNMVNKEKIPIGCHRDMHPDNIFVDINKNDEVKVSLIDFDLSITDNPKLTNPDKIECTRKTLSEWSPYKHTIAGTACYIDGSQLDSKCKIYPGNKKPIFSKNPKDLYAELDKNISYYVKDIDNDIYQYYLIYLKFIHDYDIYADETGNSINKEFERKKNIRKLMKLSLVKAELVSGLNKQQNINTKKIQKAELVSGLNKQQNINTKKIHVSTFLIEIHKYLDEIINNEKDSKEITEIIDRIRLDLTAESGILGYNVKLSNLHEKFLNNYKENAYH